MINVTLWELSSLMLIIPAKTGVIYENQTGGSKCIFKSLEGILIPLEDSVVPSDRDFEESIRNQIELLFSLGREFDQDSAEKIDEILSKYDETIGIKIDKSKLSESYEAWLHVIVNDTPSSLYSGLNNSEAVLTWNNSV